MNTDKKIFSKEISIEKTAGAYGTAIAVLCIVYFLLMKLLGIAAIPEYRFFNFVILLIGLAVTLKRYKTVVKGRNNYLEGFGLSFITALVSSSIFAIFIFIYFWKMDPELLLLLRENAPIMGQHLTPLSAAVSVIAEGLVGGLVLSFALMQYFKEDSLHNPLKKSGTEME